MSFSDNLNTLLAEACDEAIQAFRQTDKAYCQSVKRRAELSPVVAMLAEQEGEFLLTEEMRKCMAEYIALLTGPKEFEVLVACYTHGMRDCIKLLRRLGVLRG